jgi:hypothetical protein
MNKGMTAPKNPTVSLMPATPRPARTPSEHIAHQFANAPRPQSAGGNLHNMYEVDREQGFMLKPENEQSNL